MATSNTLTAIAGQLKPGDLRNKMESHADDELRHSRMFAALADSISDQPNENGQEREQFNWIIVHDQNFVSQYNGDITDFVCDLFAGEVRTFSFVSAYIVALDDAKSESALKCSTVLQRVLEDERRHIRYTGLQINDWMERGLDLTRSIRLSFENFNKNSWIEVMETAKHFVKDRNIEGG